MDFFFCQQDNAVFAADADGGEAAAFDGFEGVLDLVEPAFVAEDGDVVFRALT